MADVTLEVEEGVAVLTLDNPDVKNALSFGMAQKLIALCDEIDGRPDIAVTIVRGAGPTFCSGADTRAWSADLLSDEGFDSIGTTYGSFLRVGRLQTPTIAAVRGAAVGAGLNLMMATDVRIVAEDVRLIAGFLRIGIHPGGGFFTLVGRTAGREAAMAMGLFGEEMSGQRAVDSGLAWEAVPADHVFPRAEELAHRISSDPLLARRAVASARRELGPPSISWDAAVEVERASQLWTLYRRAMSLSNSDDAD